MLTAVRLTQSIISRVHLHWPSHVLDQVHELRRRSDGDNGRSSKTRDFTGSMRIIRQVLHLHLGNLGHGCSRRRDRIQLHDRRCRRPGKRRLEWG